MIVVLILAIIGGWILACLLRRRYIRKREREFELRPPATPWVAGNGHPSATGGPYGGGAGAGMKGKSKESTEGTFISRPIQSPRMGTPAGEKKWVVTERT
jgi:hypothetical protein